MPPPEQEGDSYPIPYSLESYVHQQPMSPPETYPIPVTGMHDTDAPAFPLNYRNLSVEEKKEHLVITRNSLELLSSILNAETEPKPLKEDLTVSMLEKCKQSQPVIKGIIESTTDNEGMLFEALYLHDELQQVVSKYEQLEAAQNFEGQQPENAESVKHDQSEATQKVGEQLGENSYSSKHEELEAASNNGEKLPEKSCPSEAQPVDPPKGDDFEPSPEKR